MATRLGAAALASLGAIELITLVARALLSSLHPGLLDLLAGAAGVAGILLLAANRVTNRSAGAVDNAAGGVGRPPPPGAPPPPAGAGGVFPRAPGVGLLGARGLSPGRGHPLGGPCGRHFPWIDDRGFSIPLGPPARPPLARV